MHLVLWEHFFFCGISVFHMDSFCWLGLVVLCSLWIRALAVGMERKLLYDLHGALISKLISLTWFNNSKPLNTSVKQFII